MVKLLLFRLWDFNKKDKNENLDKNDFNRNWITITIKSFLL